MNISEAFKLKVKRKFGDKSETNFANPKTKQNLEEAQTQFLQSKNE